MKIEIHDSSGAAVVAEFDAAGSRMWPLVERTTYCVRLSQLPSNTLPRVTLSGRELTRDHEDGGFLLSIGHTPGHFVLSIACMGEEQVEAVRVEPRQEKLDSDAWLRMLEDLEAWHPGLVVGIDGAALGHVSSTGVDGEILAIALLPLVPALLAAIDAIVREPREQQVGARHDVPLHRVRRADRTATRQAMRSPAVRAALDRWGPDWIPRDDVRISHRHSLDTLDHPLHCFLAWMLRRIVMRLQALAMSLEKKSRNPWLGDETREWCATRSSAAALAARQLERTQRRSFLGGLKARPASPAVLQIIHDDPAYARAYRLGRAFLRPRFSFEDESESATMAPARTSFDLYELWTFLAVWRSLRLTLPNWRWEWKPKSGPTLIPGFAHGSRVTGHAPDSAHHLDLVYNRTFLGFLDSRRGDHRYSLSGQRRPDIVVVYSGRWIVLDAKYRVGRKALANAFESLHIYRDALVVPGAGGRPRAGLLLVPEVESSCAPWASATFIEQHGLGCWRLRPGDPEDDRLGGWIAACLELPR